VKPVLEKVVTFGEIMLRLTPPGYQRIVQAASFEASYAGGEANVAAMLAAFGLEAYFVTKVPNNLLGQAALNYLRRYGIKVDYVATGGARLGIYFLEHGYSQRASLVIYDRANSAIAESKRGDFHWDKIFEGATWFHFTGITPALGDSAAALTLEAVQAAKNAGILVSCDLNYRKNLWDPAKANTVMSSLMPYVDLCIGNEEDAATVFGIKAANTDITRGVLDQDGYVQIAQALRERFGFKYVATSLRESYSASRNGWSVMFYDGVEAYFSRKYDISIIDRVGGGDSFAGALIYALLKKDSFQECVEFAAAASCLKHTIPGDFNLVSLAEVEKLARGDASGRVSR
jgi:2-dehydro-3-deoxygluconokinase